MKPESSNEDQLEINALECLGAIPIESMGKCVLEIWFYHCFHQNTRFANCSCWFIDAYACWLNGKQAAWAARKYKSIEFFLKALCMILMLQEYSKLELQCIFTSSPSIFVQSIWFFTNAFQIHTLTKCWDQNFYQPAVVFIIPVVNDFVPVLDKMSWKM